MKKFYIHVDSKQLGPFDIEELKSYALTKDTPIWYEGLSEWTTMENIEELKELITIVSPPPYKAPKNNTPPPFVKESKPQSPKPETLVKEPVITKKTKNKSNKGTLIGLIIGTIVLIPIGVYGTLYIIDSINNNGGDSRNSSGSYKEKVMSVEDIERSSPLDFLEVNGEYNTNFWGNKFVIKGAIQNTATVASYKDVVLRIIYYSKTQSVVTTKDHTLYDIFPAHTLKRFELKVDRYEGTESIRIEIAGAVPY